MWISRDFTNDKSLTNLVTKKDGNIPVRYAGQSDKDAKDFSATEGCFQVFTSKLPINQALACNREVVWSSAYTFCPATRKEDGADAEGVTFFRQDWYSQLPTGGCDGPDAVEFEAIIVLANESTKAYMEKKEKDSLRNFFK